MKQQTIIWMEPAILDRADRFKPWEIDWGKKWKSSDSGVMVSLNRSFFSKKNLREETANSQNSATAGAPAP